MNLEHCIDASLQRHESQKAFGLSNYLCQEKVFSGRAPPSTQARFNPWGQVAAGGIGATALNFTGQRLDATGLNGVGFRRAALPPAPPLGNRGRFPRPLRQCAPVSRTTLVVMPPLQGALASSDTARARLNCHKQ